LTRIFYTVAVFFASIAVNAQSESAQWALQSGFIDFRQSPPIYTPAVYGVTGSGNITACDKNGNLQFYGNSLFIRNREQQAMPGFRDPNGGIYHFLQGSVNINYRSQTIVTVPWPGRDSLYYLFYWDSGSGIDLLSAKLRYAIVNMNRDSGRGDVVSRDTILLSGQQICDKITVALHCNKKDFWVIGHYLNSDKYFSLLVSQSGVANTPILSNGNFISASVTNYSENTRGYIKVSPIGDKIACGFRGNEQFTEYGNFNSATGQVSNIIKLYAKPSWALPTSFEGNYGIEFSASGKYLYLSEIYNVQWPCCVYPTGHLWQYDLSSNNPVAIQASKFLVDSTMADLYYGLQYAINGKIYLNKDYYSIDVINNPEGAGFASNVQRDNINTGNINGQDFPNFPGNLFRYPVITTNNCQFQNISFSLQNTVGVGSVNWNFGDPASGINNTSNSLTPTHIFTNPGAYRVRLVVIPSNGCANDTLYKIVHAGELKVFLGNDTAICQNDTLKLKLTTPIPYATYLWNNGSTDSTIKITQSGQYWVKVFVGDCYAVDTINVMVRSLSQFTLGNDTAICGNQPYILQPQPAYASANYLWNTNAATQTIVAANPGLYWLRLTNQFGCKYRDSINISFKTLPSFNLGSDTALCAGQTLQLRANVAANNYLWNTGATAQQITTGNTGWYWCDATLNRCTYRDSIYVLFKPLPNVNLGSDTTLCEDVTYPLNVTNPSATYIWQDGSNTPNYSITQPGTYRVKVTMNGCEKSDTVVIKYDLKPRVNLGPDLVYCKGMQIALKPEIQYAQSLSWQNGSTAPVYIATQEGIYSITAINDCGDKSDSIEITKGVCKLYVPTAFTPNGDGVNDIFKVQFGEGITQFEMSIYNRWGQRVFYSIDKNKGWDGRTSGKLQPGVYLWAIKYREAANLRDFQIKGTVVVIR
jgi:gliding motility-associated-like protein